MNTLRVWRAGWWIAALVTGAGLLLVLAGTLRISHVAPFAAIVGLRNALTVLACLGFAASAIALLWRQNRPLAAPLAAGLLVLTIVSGTVVVGRGFSNDRPAPMAAGTLRILSWNTNGDLVDPPTVAALAARLDATIMVLPDADIGTDAGSYERAFRNANHPMLLRAAGTPTARIAVYVAAPYNGDGNVTVGPDPDRTLRVTPNTPNTANLPTIVAVHAAQPTWGGTAEWNTEQDWVAGQCRSGQVIAVGDFNATVDSFDNAALGRCVDTATARHAASVGTWPTRLPTWLGMPIDHVLATPDWRVRSFTVITDEDESGALHRPIFTVLSR